MTRAVVAAVHGDVFASLRYNPLGIFVAVLAIAVLVRPQLLRIRPPVWLFGVVLGALAAYNIALNPTFT
jgi:hypothetical protein